MTDKTKALLIVIVTLAITLIPMLYGNIIAKKGGLVDDALLDRTNPYYQMDRTVKAFGAEGLKTSDAVSFVIRFDNGFSSASVARIKEVTDWVKQAFPEYGVLSLSVAAAYHDTGSALSSKPYITPELLQEIQATPGWNPAAWKRAVANDPGVYGLLIGRKFDYAVVTLLLPTGYDEIALFRRVATFLEQRDIPLWEWYLKTDITPAAQFHDILPAGWVVGRGLMDAALISNNMKLSSLGLTMVTVAFYLSLMSVRQALMAALTVLISFVWVRGSLGLLQWCGLQLYERVYFLIVYSSLLVSGISFTERKFNAWNEAREAAPGLSRAALWRRTGAVNEMILVVAFIAILNFSTLYQIQVHGILEVGIFSAIGIAALVILTLWFLPALHILVGGDQTQMSNSSSGRLALAWNRFLKGVVDRCCMHLDNNSPRHQGPKTGQAQGTAPTTSHPSPFTWQPKARRYALLSFALMLTAVVVIGSDYFPRIKTEPMMLEVKTKPMEFIRNTVVFRANDYLNVEGRYGFDRLNFVVMPKKSAVLDEPVADPIFLAAVDRLKQRVNALADVREVNSVVDTIKVIARESYHQPLPTTSQQAHDILQTIEWDLGPQIKEQLWFNRGLVLFASAAMEDSIRTGQINSRIMELARREFPELEVLAFGKLALYPQADRYISTGKPINVLTSQWIVVLVCTVRVMFRARRLTGGHLALSGWRTGLVMSMPFIFATAAIALLMVMLRVPLDQSTACITALAINATIDFGLYLTADYQNALGDGADRREALHYSLAGRGKIVVVDIVLNAVCFLPLVTSTFLPVARLGWVMVIMMLACGFGSLVILPALLPWCVKNKEVVSHETA